jgi:hypothetical protein
VTAQVRDPRAYLVDVTAPDVVLIAEYEFASATKGLAGGCPGGVGDGGGAALYATREGAGADGQAERAGQEHGDRHVDEAVGDGGTGDLVGMPGGMNGWSRFTRRAGAAAHVPGMLAL